MSQTTVKVQLQQRIDTSSNWTSAGTTVLLSGEIGWESDTKKYKIGDGSTAWSSLAYAPGAGGYTAGNGISISGSNVITASVIALSTIQTAANETAMLALTTQEGDVVVRSDQSKTYMKNNGTAGSMADFTELATPTDAVTSVNGNTGAITADQLAAAIESATDSNTFTDADHTKLNSLSTTPEGTAIISTGESGGTKFLREDGDGSCSWQSVDLSSKANLSGATFTGDVVFTGDAANVTWDKSTDDLIFNDNAKAAFGTGSDLEIYFDGTTNRIDAVSGNLHIKGSNLSLKSYANETYLDATANGAVEIFFNNRKTAETLTSGFRVSSPDGDAQLQIFGFEGSDAILKLGADEGDDNPDWYQIIHDHSDTNSLRIQNYADGAYEDNIICRHGAGVELYYDAGSPSFETTSTGAKVTGTIEAGAASFTDDGSTGPVINISGDDSNVWFGRLGNESYHDNVGTGFKFYVTNDGHAQFYHTGNAEYRNWLIGSYDGTTYKTDIYKVASSGNLALYQDGNIRLTTTAAGVTVTGSVTDDKGDVRKIIKNAQTGASSYAFTAADVGKCISRSGGNVHFPANDGSVLVPGDAITIINNSASNITIDSGTNSWTMYNTADAATGNRTIPARGMATVYVESNAVAYISGAGLS